MLLSPNYYLHNKVLNSSNSISFDLFPSAVASKNVIICQITYILIILISLNMLNFAFEMQGDLFNIIAFISLSYKSK